ncbi:hypothetical protein ABIE44_003594 [Marmoricola sp. OAE513]|uniref:hypothetical protein n=1 Tax=Marmoricola sp. OAE513 TaxID=2817894 RepID=UPI001AEA100A
MSTVRRALSWSALVVVLTATVVLLGWRVHGGGWARVETPSMGTRAPVGSLLWVEPVDVDDVRVGDLLTFRPPGSEQTYSHLVAAVNSDGTLSTRGAITGADPWRITAAEIVGRTTWVWPGVGWLVVAAPVLGVGALLVWWVVRRLRDPDLREPVAVLGSAVVLAVALVVYRPLLGAEQVTFTPEDGSARATYVGTGVLPVRLSGRDGASVVLRPGEVGGVTAAVPDDDGGTLPGTQPRRFTVTLGAAVGWPWWAALVGACFLPAALTTARTTGRRAARSTAAVH